MTKKMILALLAVALPFLLRGEIIEIMHMAEVYEHLENSPLIVLDIDNTLIEPIQELGSNQWFEKRIDEYRSHGMPSGEALEKALREWTAIQSITKVRTVEPVTAGIVKDLQQKGYTVMGLTTRGLGISTCTVQQLEAVKIDLSATAPTNEELFFMNERGVLYRGGILFTAATHKGRALKKFLELSGHKTAAILFINDKRSHLQPVAATCEEEGVPFKGLRYGYLDEKVKNFRKQIAEVQFYFFGHILSDEAAERILHES